MASLKLSHIYKVYENGHKAVNDFNIDIEDKEFIVFVGPSGCGKSTTLRMIAGLEDITAGDMFIGDTLVNDMEPKDRDIAMVFQSYALYPHMTVFENMAFGLRNRHMPEEEIKQRVLEAARILDITDYLDRKPKAMSGGQRQRVALGRALVRNPKVFLLDEPLSNLDAKLRAAMRTEITKLHKRLATTFIYVTHDQVEAMTMGTRIVVMKLGYVQQIDTPMNLYNKPYNKFVAGFIGTPQMNFFDVVLDRKGNDVSAKFVDGSVLKLPYARLSKIHDSYLHGEKKVIFGIRPEHIEVSEAKTGLNAVITAVEHLGNECIIYGTLGKKEEEFTMADSGRNVIVKTIESQKYNVGDVINLSVMEDKVHFFDAETEITLISDIPAYSQFEGAIKSGKLEFLGSKLELAPYLKEQLEGKSKLVIEVPPSAIIEGKDYSLKVNQIEKVGEQNLAYLEVGDRFLFALVDDKVKAGAKLSFSLRNDKIRILDAEGNVLLEPVDDEVSFNGTFNKYETKEKHERVLHFNYNINGVNFEAPVNNGYKMNAVEGNACYRNTYRYQLNRDDVLVEANGIAGSVKKVLDYGNACYALVDFGGQEVLINNQERELAVDNDIFVTVKPDVIGVYSLDIDMKIC